MTIALKPSHSKWTRIRGSDQTQTQESQAEREKAAKGENGASMGDSGQEASPKGGFVGDGSHIAVEHDFHV